MKLPLKLIVTAVAASPEGRKALKSAVKALNTPANRAKAQKVLKDVKARSGSKKKT
jgi:hypothetical protein